MLCHHLEVKHKDKTKEPLEAMEYIQEELKSLLYFADTPWPMSWRPSVVHAVLRDDTDRLHQLLICKYARTQTLDFHVEDETPLTKAVSTGQLHTVKTILCKGAIYSTDFPNKDGKTPLMIAAGCGYKDICRLLIPLGADPNYENMFNHTALNEAVQHGQTEVASYLFEQGANLSISTIESAMLINDRFAAEILKLSLHYQKHPKLRFPIGTVIDLAIRGGENFAIFTLRQGFYPQKETRVHGPYVSLFHKSAKYGYVKLMSVLAELNLQLLQEEWLIQKQYSALPLLPQDYIVWLNEYRKQVPSLFKLCKSTILAQLSIRNEYYKANVNVLPLPKCLKSYLLVTESVYNHTV